MVSSPKADINLTRACTDQMIREASVIPVTGAGIGWALQEYVMDGGWFDRSMPSWWNCERVWLNK
jgi:hypothetical protein